jgi:hypothetical protein
MRLCFYCFLIELQFCMWGALFGHSALAKPSGVHAVFGISGAPLVIDVLQFMSSAFIYGNTSRGLFKQPPDQHACQYYADQNRQEAQHGDS